MHKTATTALQAFFAQNSHVLKKNGLLYPMTGRTGWGSHHHFASSIKDSYDPNVPPYNTFQGYLQEFKKESQEIGSVLISSEIFSEEIDRTRLVDLKAVFDNVFIVIYLRPQYSYVESYYNEKVKDGDCTETIIEMTKSLVLDYFQICEEWSSLFGKDHIIVRPFEKTQLVNNDIFSDFLSIMGMPVDDKYSGVNNMLNSSLKRDALEFKLIANSLPISNPDIRDIGNIALKTFSAKHPNNEFNDLLSPEERFKIMQEFEASNARVASDYLGRNDSQLFYEPLLSLDAPWNPYPGLSDSAIKEISLYMKENTPELFQCLAKAIIAGLCSDRKEIFSAASKLVPSLEMCLDTCCESRNMSVDCRCELDSILNSRSWRYTAPFRRIGYLIRKIRQ
jgi:hypothetical protein